MLINMKIVKNVGLLILLINGSVKCVKLLFMLLDTPLYVTVQSKGNEDVLNLCLFRN